MSSAVIVSSRGPSLSNIDVDHSINQATFTLNNVDVCYANALRRTILADIPTPVFDLSTIQILKNTSRLNNEVIKQRLSCIPIHFPTTVSWTNVAQVRLKVSNETDMIRMVTSNDFELVLKDRGERESERERDLLSAKEEMFPPYSPDHSSKYYIDIVRLRPKLSSDIPSEEIELVCTLKEGTARQHGGYNVVGTCSFGHSIDKAEQTRSMAKRREELSSANPPKTDEEIEFELKNWLLLDGKRVTKKNSFDFVMESIGVYTNTQIWRMACRVLLGAIGEAERLVANHSGTSGTSRGTSTSTISHDSSEHEPNVVITSHDDNWVEAVFTGFDMGIGNMINYELYSTFFQRDKSLEFVGVKKMHPHDNSWTIRAKLATGDIGASESFVHKLRQALEQCQSMLSRLVEMTIE